MTSFCGHFTYIQKHCEGSEMNDEMTQWKCFVPDTPSFSDHIWSYVDHFSKSEHEMAMVRLAS